MTLHGTVEAGVEAGCLLLNGYLLLGGDHDVVVAGAEVVVEGTPAPGTMTTCQQGIPFHVTKAERARP
ncbi:hypothetical protein Lesp02_72960 [Lentzea sp. NBRC 105346]|uniref:hypothetical protein n=1 Tax=Lentzea sp. NBRC 105346 TaxID=3032205 RepID=UPI0024A39A88|nr:hypothetical protein [Lentzea sp. NBRC 105346]GLZ35109.1 hypothetical protein Lesp02_72960 [Lentzea sp. NBRC 105346]